MPFIIERKIDLTILKIEHEDKIDQIQKKIKEVGKRVDVIDILNPTKRLRKAFNEFFYRPLKITYVMKAPESLDSYLATLTRNRRKRILKCIRECEHKGITLRKEEFLTQESFKAFYKVYKKNIGEKKRGIMTLHKAWYAKRSHDACGVFAIRKKKIIGGILLKKKRNSMSFCYSSSEKPYFGINDFLNVHAIVYTKELGFSHIIRGQDTNLYGHHLSPGLYLFKKSLGFSIQPRKKQGFALTQIVNYDRFGDSIFFITINDANKLEASLFLKNHYQKPDEFVADFIEKLHVYYIGKE